jgi:ABC-type nitrate/sulfonate/bicarbonate transport system substrate-binding protein
VRNDANITKVSDLAQKKIAVPQGTGPSQGLDQLLQEAHLKRDSVARVNATFGNMGPMLVQGSVDAMVGLEPFLTLTKEKMPGNATILVRLGKYVQGGGLFLIFDKWAREHPDKIVDAVAALWEGQKWVRDHRAEAATIMAEFLKADSHSVNIAFDYLDFDPIVDDFTLQSLNATSKYLAEQGIIQQPVNVEEHLGAYRKTVEALKLRSH